MTWMKFLATLLWPFVKEMVLNGKTIVEAFKENKRRVFFAFFVMGCFLANMVLVSRIVAISREHVVLQEKYSALFEASKQNPKHSGLEVKQNKEPPKIAAIAVPSEVDVPDNTPVKPKPSKTSGKKSQQHAADDERFDRLQATFDRIREREQKGGEVQ